jgi:hypothetical protein
MTPETAVARLAEIVDRVGAFSEDTVYEAMAQAGIPDALADRAYKFTQSAWARAFLGGVGVRFPPDYLCFNAEGEVIESGKLDQEACFIEAMRLVPKYAKSAGFTRLLRMSADVSTVNNALNKGSKPENLAMGPAAFFMEAPTQAGIGRARQLLADRVSAARRDAGSGGDKTGR